MMLDPPSRTSTTSVLTAAEMAFAIRAGVPLAVFDEDISDLTPPNVDHSPIDGEEIEELYDTQQVAKHLNRHPTTVRRMSARGDLFKSGRINRGAAFPTWQFTPSGVLPDLRQIIAAFPRGYHPRDIGAVMTAPAEELRGYSPRAWLARGGAPGVLLDLLRELSL